jgi:hypothetical protein
MEKYIEGVGKYIYEEDKHILTIVFSPVVIDRPQAEVMTETLDEIIKEFNVSRMGVISDMRELLHMTRQARELFAEESRDQVIADAIVLNSPILRQLYNISMKFTPPKYPVKAFTSLTAARQWVEQELSKYNF